MPLRPTGAGFNINTQDQRSNQALNRVVKVVDGLSRELGGFTFARISKLETNATLADVITQLNKVAEILNSSPFMKG